MAARVRFINTITGQNILPKKGLNPATEVAISGYLKHWNRLPRPQQANVHTLPSLTSTKKKAIRGKLHKILAVPHRSSNAGRTPFSRSQAIVLFYTALNEKNMKQLNDMIAEDCFFDDLSFPKPFRGKKEVLPFLEQLIACMGQNMQFNIDHICEGEDNTVGINWHLDWNKLQVPFTRGCSNYSLSVNVDKIVIEKAQILIESPIKLGMVAMAIFKIVSSLFDAFPAATVWFLTSPHVVFRLLLKAYNVIIWPIIGPSLAWYIKLLNTGASILGLTLEILYQVIKFFHYKNQH